MNRIDRLTAILIQLQTKRVVKAEEIADRFEISLRTVYRDVKALMEAGVPIGSEAGKGYFIVDGFHLPPVMFTQDEASAMLLAGKLVDKMADKSVRAAYQSAIFKIKAVLHESEKDHLENLQAHIEVMIRSKTEEKSGREFPDHFMTEIQRAVARREVLLMGYVNVQDDETQREIEPIGLFYYNLSWHLIAWCRLRNGYRDFRCDRITSLSNTQQKFETRNILSLQEYLQTIHLENQNLVKAVVLFDKKSIRGRSIYGSVSQHDEGDKLRVEFLMDNIGMLARWLLPYGSNVEVVEPAELNTEMKNLVNELYFHFIESHQLLGKP